MFEGKRFLITHIWLRGFGGAEINILELSKYLSENGAKVDVFTFIAGEPLLSKFKDLKNTEIITDFEHDFKVEDYDYVISAQNILPNSIIRGLAKKRKKTPKFMFLHMSSLVEMPLEQPIIYGLEEKISSASLAISDKIIERNLSRFFENIPGPIIYPNPSPVEYSSLEMKKRDRVKIILSISNHPPEEIRKLKDILPKKGVQIDYIGVWSDRYELVDANLLKKYDAIIGIGKNAQYCLTAGIPVYVYDHYCGPGYLNENNYDAARNFHFSGRELEGVSKTAEEIANEIIEGYEKSFEFQSVNRDKFINQFSIDKIFPEIIERISDNKKDIIFDEKYVEYVIAMNYLLKNNVAQKDNDSIEYKKMFEMWKAEADKICAEKNKLAAENDRLKSTISKISNSKFYKLGVKISSIKKKNLKG